MNIFIATSNGLVIAAQENGDWEISERALSGKHITSVIAREGVILVGSRDGVMRSDDSGKTWRDASNGLTEKYVRWLAYHPDISDCEFAGTEPANIFVSRDGAQTWRECSEIPPLRDAHHWFLPYSKGAGCVRGFAFCGSRAYAAVEVGGALRSDDWGATWRLCDGSNGNPDLEGPPAPLIYPDVHSIESHSATPNWVFAPTGGGFYTSRDGGTTWMLAYDCYVRALWVNPNNADHFILAPADGVDRNGRIEESRDGGATWTNASDGLAAPWKNHMVERFKQVGDELFAVLSNGEIFGARVEEWKWKRAFAEIKNAHALWAS
ncbi:MAG: exo-alpha-sialidase [Chloroflexota bacterium]|nr:MAG: exo-alpha-sialidase [Chloroflexota bacterium]